MAPAKNVSAMTQSHYAGIPGQSESQRRQRHMTQLASSPDNESNETPLPQIQFRCPSNRSPNLAGADPSIASVATAKLPKSDCPSKVPWIQYWCPAKQSCSQPVEQTFHDRSWHGTCPNFHWSNAGKNSMQLRHIAVLCHWQSAKSSETWCHPSAPEVCEMQLNIASVSRINPVGQAYHCDCQKNYKL